MSPLCDYAFRSLLWGVFGLVIGFLLGRMTRDTQRIADAVTDEESAVPDDPKKSRRRPSYQAVMGAVVVLLGLVTAVQGLYQDAATRRVADCTRAYSDGFAAALDARSEASTAAQNALDELMSTVGSLTTGPDAGTAETRDRFRKSLSEYLAKRAEAKKQQQEHPYPPAPRDVCSE